MDNPSFELEVKDDQSSPSHCSDLDEKDCSKQHNQIENSCPTSTASTSCDDEGPVKESSNDKKNSSVGLRRYLGMMLAFIAALQYSLSALTIKLIAFHPFNLGVWRFTSMIFITFPFLIHGQLWQKKSKNCHTNQTNSSGILSQVWPLNKTTGLLILQACLGSNSIMFVFFGLSYLNIGDSIVIGTSAPVFVTIVAWVFLREPCGVIPVFTAVLAMVGVGVICKPPILTGNAELNQDTVAGVSYSLASMMLLTFCYVLIRYLRKVHHALIQFTFAVWGLLESLVMAYLFGVLTIPGSWKEVALIVLNAFLAFSAQTAITLALKYEQAGVVSLVRTTEVVFCYLWQLSFLNGPPDIFSIIGALLTLFCVVLAALRKTVLSLPDNHKYKKKFSYLLI